MAKIILTTDEAEALGDFLYDALIPFIQDRDNDVDNLRWVHLLTSIWLKCEEGKEKT